MCLIALNFFKKLISYCMDVRAIVVSHSIPIFILVIRIVHLIKYHLFNLERIPFFQGKPHGIPPLHRDIWMDGGSIYSHNSR
jgi:hypothetical protein